MRLSTFMCTLSPSYYINFSVTLAKKNFMHREYSTVPFYLYIFMIYANTYVVYSLNREGVAIPYLWYPFKIFPPIDIF